MKVVLLANMGSPESEKDMKIFLCKMFRDKAIINTPWSIRFLLSVFISNFCYKKSWKKYMQIGGSPLYNAMHILKNDLQKQLLNEYSVMDVYSYSKPFIKDELIKQYKSGIKDFIIIPMYPHESFSTTGSLLYSINNVKKRYKDINIQFVRGYFNNHYFIKFWVSLIHSQIINSNFSNPYLLYCAHAVPKPHIKRGDLYAKSINISSQLISAELNLPYSICYYSKMGRIKWTEPDCINHLIELHKKNINQIIVIPISFLNENLETLYDLDVKIIPYSLKNIGIKDICRINIPNSHPLLVKMFYELIIESS